MRRPVLGELVYGCEHPEACGQVVEVARARPRPDLCGRCYFVTEGWSLRVVRVRREANGQLYEVTTSAGHD